MSVKLKNGKKSWMQPLEGTANYETGKHFEIKSKPT
jgi:hypothetical protein